MTCDTSTLLVYKMLLIDVVTLCHMNGKTGKNRGWGKYNRNKGKLVGNLASLKLQV